MYHILMLFCIIQPSGVISTDCEAFRDIDAASTKELCEQKLANNIKILKSKYPDIQTEDGKPLNVTGICSTDPEFKEFMDKLYP